MHAKCMLVCYVIIFFNNFVINNIYFLDKPTQFLYQILCKLEPKDFASWIHILSLAILLTPAPYSRYPPSPPPPHISPASPYRNPFRSVLHLTIYPLFLPVRLLIIPTISYSYSVIYKMVWPWLDGFFGTCQGLWRVTF